jgi:Calcineurin-like phosphoesterase
MKKNAFIIIFSLLLFGTPQRASCQLKNSIEEKNPEEFQVVILGDSSINAIGLSGEEEKSSQILSHLFKIIKVINPDAIFFTGNLTKGLSEDTPENSVDNLYLQEDRLPTKKKYVYTDEAYKKQLDAFSGILKKNLGELIPFYPLIGENQLGGENAVKVFIKHFGITNLAPLDAPQLAYSVNVGNGFFVAIGTDWYDPNKSPSTIGNAEIKMLNWLFDILHENINKGKYLFVLGHEPAYSTTGTSGNYQGMDKNPEELSLFWKILRVNGVNAYFSGRERLFDRSNRQGVWQIALLHNSPHVKFEIVCK